MLLPLLQNNVLSVAGASASITAGPWTEAQIVSGGQTIVITLSDDTFVTFNDTIRQAIIDGLTSAQTEPLGWNNEVRDNEVVGAVVRDSTTQVTITLTAATSYAITADETITVTIPASALTGAVEVVATPTVGITADVAVAVEKYHTISFISQSRGMSFSAQQRRTEFSSSSRSVIITGRDEPAVIGYILKEDGFNLLFESGRIIKRE